MVWAVPQVPVDPQTDVVPEVDMIRGRGVQGLGFRV